MAPQSDFASAKADYVQGRHADASDAICRLLQFAIAEDARRAASPAPVAPGDPVLVGGSIPRPAKVKDAAAGYPDDAQLAGATGIVTLDIVVDRDGNVSHAQLVHSVYKSLDAEALSTVRKWKYAPTLVNGQRVPVRMLVNLRFGPGSTPATREYLDLAEFDVSAHRYDEAAAALQQVLSEFQRYAALEGRAVRPGASPAPCANGQTPIVMPTLVTKVTPVYPLVMKAAHIEGAVVIQAIVSKTGAVEDAYLVKSAHSLLDQSALDAARRWVYTPTLQCGQPVDVIITITVGFALR
jgi:TonB family protein